MAGRVLLDTNVLIRVSGQAAAVVAALGGFRRVYASSVAMGELYFGACKSARVERNVERVEELARIVRVLACDMGTARAYGQIKDELRRAGRPIPENDLWIAVTARQHGLALATNDAHFDRVEGLELVRI